MIMAQLFGARLNGPKCMLWKRLEAVRGSCHVVRNECSDGFEYATEITKFNLAAPRFDVRF